MSKIRIYFVALFIIIMSASASGQEELSLFYYKNILQSGQLMPAHLPDYGTTVSMGSTYGHLDYRGSKLLHFVFDNVDYVYTSGNIGNMYVSADLSLHLLDFGFYYKDFYIKGGMLSQNHLFSSLDINLTNLLFSGNSKYVSQNVEIGPELYLQRTSEIYLGLAVPIYDIYQFGANLKIISGGVDISTPKSTINLRTDEAFYEFELENDLLINTSYNSLFKDNFSDLLPFSGGFNDNLGVSADFGFVYNTNFYDISASLLDVGIINWKSNSTSYRSKGKYKFEGLGLDEVNLDTINRILDTLKNDFGVEVTKETYTTFTPLKIVLGGEYHFSNWDLGGQLYGEIKQNRFIPAIQVNARRKLWKFWDVGISYAYKNNTFSNLGLSSVMKLGIFQFYAISDNVLGPFLPFIDRKFNLRIGTNIVFKRESPKKSVALL